jgi:Tfp pilus assembly protein PilE
MNHLKLKKQWGFSLIEAMIIVAMMGVLSTVAIPSYQDYQMRSKWEKAIFSTAALRLAIGECLLNTTGNPATCNDFTPFELPHYGITALPTSAEAYFSVSIIPQNAAVKIVGSTALAHCVVDLVPGVDSNAGNIIWTTHVQTATKRGASVAKCKSYLEDTQ